jgi:nucleoside-diphosphate-sugar epimerase
MTERARHERVLITGVTGFIGSRVAARWIERGAQVRGLVRQPVDIPGVEAVVGDMRDAASLAPAVDGIDVVVHAAADFGTEVDAARRVNEDGTRALAEAALAAGCRRFVHLSTCGVYALEGLDLVTEETPLWPEARADELTYGATKAMGERALAEVAAAGLGVVILRPPNVLGAHPRSDFVEVLATRVRDGAIGYALDGANTWPYVHVEDLVDAVEAAADRPIEPGRAFTIVAGHTTWRAFLEDYAGWFGVEVAQREPRSVYDHFRGRFSTARARAELGFAPRRSYADALAETRQFLVGRGIVPRTSDA